MAFRLFGWGVLAPRSKSAIVCCDKEAAFAKSCCVMPDNARAARQKSEVDNFIAPLGFILTLPEPKVRCFLTNAPTDSHPMKVLHKLKSERLTCIESFCGAGGMSLGLGQAGFDVRLSFDKDEAAIQTHNLNLGPTGHVIDAWKISGKELLRKAGLREVDLFSGGPPCQGFSKQRRGAHRFHDPRNALVIEFVRLVEETKPRSFLFENVEIVGQIRGREFIAQLLERLSHYEIYSFRVNSSDFGLAQTRGRFLMMGFRPDIGAAIPFLIKDTRKLTVRDVIGDLPPPPVDCTEHSKFANHLKCRINAANEERISHVPQGGGWQDIPFHLRLPCHKVDKPMTGGWPDVYGRLAWDGQCPTITAGFDSFSRGRYAHPVQNRSLTLREGARLQGFPDKFRFIGTRHDVRYQIGNAVPPPLARAAGEAIKRALAKQQYGGQQNVSMPEGSDRQLSLAV
jgi:DNA (cytosine-5)-methyltransferase 1